MEQLSASETELPGPLLEALKKLALRDRLLVALDFDGTLAPHVDDPEEARALPEARAALERLVAAPRTRVALISGRALESLLTVADPPESVLLVGSHGVELRLEGTEVQSALDPAEAELVRVLGRVLGEVAASFENVWLESKPAGFALHTRLATPDHARAAPLAARERAAAEVGELTVREGKDVLEFSVRSANKGESLARLREHANAEAVLFAGDDVTDEDAFAVLGPADVGIKIGPGETAAQFRVNNPAAVARTLDALADLLANPVPGRQ